MRLRSTLFDRRNTHLPAGDTRSPAKGEAGAATDSWYADLQGGGPDVNPELSGSAKFGVFDEMATTDPTIKSLLAFHALPARSAVWSLDERDPAERVSAFYRDFIAWNVGLNNELGEMDLSWRAGIGRTLTMGLKHGPAIEELVWDDVRTWRDADGDEHLVRPLSALAPRPPASIDKVKRDRGRLVSISQTIPGTDPMPADKLSYLVFDPDETGRWEGSSMLRPAWAAWRLKKALLIAAGIGWDRFASGLPVIYHPDDPDAEARAKRIGEQIRMHERAYVNIPAEGLGVSGTGRPQSEWYVDLLNGATTLADPVPLLRYYTEQETEAGLVHFSRLGTTEHGSRAVGEVQVDPYFLAVQAAAQEVARERERQVIRRIMEVNFGFDAAEHLTPKVVVSRIQARNLEVVARAISYLTPAGFTLTLGDVNDLRELLGFARLDEAAEQMGVPLESLMAVLREQGLTTDELAQIVNALPEGLGIARNRPTAEGAGLVLTP